MREQIAADAARHREAMETTTSRLRTEESQKCSLEERLEKTHHEVHALKAEHQTVSFIPKLFQFCLLIKNSSLRPLIKI